MANHCSVWPWPGEGLFLLNPNKEGVGGGVCLCLLVCLMGRLTLAEIFNRHFPTIAEPSALSPLY